MECPHCGRWLLDHAWSTTIINTGPMVGGSLVVAIVSRFAWPFAMVLYAAVALLVGLELFHWVTYSEPTLRTVVGRPSTQTRRADVFATTAIRGVEPLVGLASLLILSWYLFL